MDVVKAGEASIINTTSLNVTKKVWEAKAN